MTLPSRLMILILIWCCIILSRAISVCVGFHKSSIGWHHNGQQWRMFQGSHHHSQHPMRRLNWGGGDQSGAHGHHQHKASLHTHTQNIATLILSELLSNLKAIWCLEKKFRQSYIPPRSSRDAISRQLHVLAFSPPSLKLLTGSSLEELTNPLSDLVPEYGS